MTKSAYARLVVVAAIFLGVAIGLCPALAAVPGEVPPQGDTVPATPELIRQVQFMLQTIGIDPGPIDGNSQALTNRGVHQFELQNNLPVADIINGGAISTVFLNLLRTQAMAKLNGGAPPAPAPVPTVASIPIPATPPPLPPDRFASCEFDAKDFVVGGKQYTPQSLVDEGFAGSTDRAVVALQQRLNEARQLAAKIGGTALLEVQRQSRVLAYFQCRQKIEQAAISK